MSKKAAKLADDTATVSVFGPDGLAYTFYDDRGDLLRIGQYCAQDVIVETAIDRMVLRHSPKERRVWELDQLINERGVRLDLDLARAAVGVVEVAGEKLHARMCELTGGAVEKCSQVSRLVAWINAQGVPCASVAGALQDDIVLQAQAALDPAAAARIEEAISLRQQSGKGTPTSKYQTMLDCACADGKARGQLQFSGATTTARWSGRLIQFQNLPGVDEDLDGANVRHALDILGTPGMSAEDRYLAIRVVCGTVLPVLSKCLRRMLMASVGCRFIGGDLSNIEGCTSAWLSGEDWKVEAYLEFQRTGDKKKDLYRVAFSKAFGVAVAEVTSIQRQVGKIIELSAGFGGSIGAIVRMLAKYKMRPAMMVAPVREMTPDADWEAARARMHLPGVKTYGLTEDEWTAIRLAVDGWRAGHARLVASWYEVGDAILEAMSHGAEYNANGQEIRKAKTVYCLGDRVAYTFQRGVLWARLPSGRVLTYHRPRIRTRVDLQIKDPQGRTGWVEESEVPRLLGAGCARTEAGPRVRNNVVFEGYDGMTKRWATFDLIPTLAYQNLVQATARDVMVEGMLAAEASGYPIVLTVHDELLCDVPIGHGSPADLKRLMTIVPDWAKGLPLAAKTWEALRYEK